MTAEMGWPAGLEPGVVWGAGAELNRRLRSHSPMLYPVELPAHMFGFCDSWHKQDRTWQFLPAPHFWGGQSRETQ